VRTTGWQEFSKEEVLRDELAAQGLNSKQITEIIHNKRLEGYRPAEKTNPWEEDTTTVKILNTTNIGLADTHKVKTSIQDLNAHVQKKFDKHKAKKQGDNLAATSGSAGAQLENLETTKKEQKKNAQKEQDRQIKEQNFRDHLFEMSKGMDSLNKMPSHSEYGNEFEFNKHMQDLCNTVNFDHHLLKNDLKWFAEAYVKYKGTMRK